MEIKYKTLSEQLYADSDYLTKLANQPKMREYCQEIINATVDINRAAFELGSKEEFILDKIRAEIEEMKLDVDLDIGNEMIYNNAIKDVLEIIDKYRGE